MQTSPAILLKPASSRALLFQDFQSGSGAAGIYFASIVNFSNSAFKMKFNCGERFWGAARLASRSFHCLSDRSWLQLFARKSPGPMDPMDLDHVGENGYAFDKDIMFPPSFNPLKLSQLWNAAHAEHRNKIIHQ